MKKLFSLLLVLALALVPTLSLADDDAACQNLYNMLLDELKSVDLEMTADEESYRIYLGYALDKNSLGDADVIFDAYSDAVTINVSYSNPLDEAACATGDFLLQQGQQHAVCRQADGHQVGQRVVRGVRDFPLC